MNILKYTIFVCFAVLRCVEAADFLPISMCVFREWEEVRKERKGGEFLFPWDEENGVGAASM